MTPKKQFLFAMLLNLAFVAMNLSFIVAGIANWFTVVAALINLFFAKLAYDGYQRSSN